MEKLVYRFLVREDDSLRTVMKAIDLNGFGVALILNEDHKYVGLVTDGDIRRAIIAGAELDSEIKGIMNKNSATLKKGFSAKDVESIFKEKEVDQLPVIDENGHVCDILLTEQINQILSHHSPLFSKETSTRTKKSVLIVGGAGYIGSTLARRLLDENYEVIVFDSFFFGEQSIQDLKGNKNFSMVKGDIGHLDKIIDAVKHADAVVQLGEIVGDPACSLDSRKTQQMNYLSTKLIAEVCKYFQVNRFIYASSCSVYGASEGNELLHEKSVLNPVSLYARMKVQSENALLAMRDGVFSPTILRLSTVFGSSNRMRFDLVVNLLTAKAVRDKEITVFGGNQWRPFVHVEDVAKAIQTVLNAPIEKVRGEIFNVGAEMNNLTILDVGNKIKELIPEAELKVDGGAEDARNYKVSFKKIREKIGFTADWDVNRGISDMRDRMQEGAHEDYRNKVYSNYKTYSEMFSQGEETNEQRK